MLNVKIANYQSQHNSCTPSCASIPDDVASSAASMTVTDVSMEFKTTLDTQHKLLPGSTAAHRDGARVA